MSDLARDKAELLGRLHTAFTLELGTIPPYMMAIMSQRHPANRVAAELIRSVMVEEMLHMTLVGNLIRALDGKVSLGPHNIPSYPLKLHFEGRRFRDRSFDVDLAPFSRETLAAFLAIELPSGWHEKAALNEVARGELDLPGLTIGQFYDGILMSLDALCAEHGELAVFSGDPAQQIGTGYYWSGGGTPIVITGLALAHQALGLVKQQGEGSVLKRDDGDPPVAGEPGEVAHFFRFREIQCGRRYRPQDLLHAPPGGEAFEVDYAAVHPLKKNPRASDYAPGTVLADLNTRFNRAYTLMLTQIAEAFSGTPRVLYTAIMNGMHELTGVAAQMVRLPIPDDPEGRHGAPSFEWCAPDPGAPTTR